ENKPVGQTSERDQRNQADNHGEHRGVHSGIEDPASFRRWCGVKSAARTRYVKRSSQQQQPAHSSTTVKMSVWINSAKVAAARRKSWRSLWSAGAPCRTGARGFGRQRLKLLFACDSGKDKSFSRHSHIVLQ